MKITMTLWVGAALVLESPAFTAHAHAQALAPHAAQRCSQEAVLAPADTTIETVRQFTTPVSYCRVDGYVTTTNPGPNKVRFMLSLPDDFKGRYLFTIQGGAAGFVPDPSDENLRLGYAIASTDKGVRTSNILDFSFRNDPAQALDWGHRGVHVTALATQEIARHYYSITKLNRYATGCSGGGDGTLAAAELHPTDFDGYVAAAMTTSSLEINHIWGALAQYETRNPAAWISPEEFQHIHEVLLARYDAADGAKDGLIWQPQKIVLARKDFAFLSDAQFGLLKFIHDGLKPERGTSYPGYWLANVTAMPRFLTGLTRPPWDSLQQFPAGMMVTWTGAQSFFGPNYDILKQLDFNDRNALIADRKFQTEHGRHVFDPANLEALRASGGKLILWTGMADQAVPPENVKSYTDRATQLYGANGRASFIRTFFVPGLTHCTGGEGAPTDSPDQMLAASVAWIESSSAPNTVIVNNSERDQGRSRQGIMDGTAVLKPATRTYLLCAYPKHSQFIGGLDNPKELDVDDSKNWHCID
jgi:hypothetical protein